jgi:hypothetical protein
VPDRALRIGHLTTVDMSLALLLKVELEGRSPRGTPSSG